MRIRHVLVLLAVPALVGAPLACSGDKSRSESEGTGGETGGTTGGANAGDGGEDLGDGGADPGAGGEEAGTAGIGGSQPTTGGRTTGGAAGETTTGGSNNGGASAGSAGLAGSGAEPGGGAQHSGGTGGSNAGTAGSGGAQPTTGGSSNGGAAGAAGAECDCDDGFSCTIDRCVAGDCVHFIGSNEGATACPAGEYCTLANGCVAAPACSTVTQCEEAWADDACKTNIACEAASALCTFEILDGDFDGHPPPVCGGADCDDSNSSVNPDATEECNGLDDDCNGEIDVRATCENSLEACIDGSCECPEEYLCGEDCVDTSSTSDHCGECFNQCPDQYTCLIGACQCSPSVCGEVVANSETPWFVAVDDTHVYWSDHGESATAGGVFRVAKSGGDPETLVPASAGPMSYIVLDGDYLYYSSTGSIGRLPRSGGSPEVIASGIGGQGMQQFAISGDTLAYHSSTTSVWTMPKTGGTPTAVDSGIDLSYGVALDSAQVYWTAYGLYGGPSYVRSQDLTTGTQIELLTGTVRAQQPLYLLVDGPVLFWTDDLNRVFTAPTDGTGAATTLASLADRPLMFAQDSFYLYVTLPYSDGSIVRVDKASGSDTVFVPVASYPLGIAVDATHVYWANRNDGTVRRIAK